MFYQERILSGEIQLLDVTDVLRESAFAWTFIHSYRHSYSHSYRDSMVVQVAGEVDMLCDS